MPRTTAGDSDLEYEFSDTVWCTNAICTEPYPGEPSKEAAPHCERVMIVGSPLWALREARAFSPRRPATTMWARSPRGRPRVRSWNMRAPPIRAGRFRWRWRRGRGRGRARSAGPASGSSARSGAHAPAPRRPGPRASARRSGRTSGRFRPAPRSASRPGPRPPAGPDVNGEVVGGVAPGQRAAGSGERGCEREPGAACQRLTPRDVSGHTDSTLTTTPRCGGATQEVLLSRLVGNPRSTPRRASGSGQRRVTTLSRV